MRKTIVFGVCGLFMAVFVGSAHAAKETISMGTFDVPLVAGNDGCTPDVTVTNKDANGCYATTIQKKKLESGSCVDDGEAIVRETCDGAKGDDGNDGCPTIITNTEQDSTTGCYTTKYQKQKWENGECVADGAPLEYTICSGEPGEVEEDIYVPYPLSESYEYAQGLGVGDEPKHEGYRRLTLKFKAEQNSRVLKFPDHCKEGEDGNHQRIKTCTAQGNATDWPNVGGTTPYQEGEEYDIVIGESRGGYPRYEYTAPRSSGNSVVAKGFTQKVFEYTDGRRLTETGMDDECKEYAKSNDRSARVTKCKVQSYQYPTNLTVMWVPNSTEYCLGNHQNDCDQYTILVGAVETCAGLTSSDTEWNTRVDTTKSEYVEHIYQSGGTTGTVGYKLTYETMCSGNTHESRVQDKCDLIKQTGTQVTCQTGYAWQECIDQTNSNNSTNKYYGCFPNNTSEIFAHKDEINKITLAADSNYLYYCLKQDCDTDNTCWTGTAPNLAPNYDPANGCWGRVSVQGLQGDAGPGCSFVYNSDNWQVCCLPVDSTGQVDINGTWSCKNIEDQNLINQLNGWMCKPTYTTYFIDKQSNGTFVYSRATTGNNRLSNTVGVRTVVKNCDGTHGTDIDVFDDDKCEGLSNADAQTTIVKQTKEYRSKDYSPNHFNPARGYYEVTTEYCTGNPVITYEQDKCNPVADYRAGTRTVGNLTCGANTTLNKCTPWEGSNDEYFVCLSTEYNGYPEKQYVAPTGSNGVLNTAGYTRWAHKYTASGGTEYEKIDDDKCYNAIKRTRNSQNTITTTKNVLKCTVQEPGTSGYIEGSSYCLFMASGEDCNDYIIAGSEDEEYELKYMSPSGSGNVLTKEGYTCRQRKLTRTASGVASSVVVNEACQLVAKDTCNKAVKHTRTTSGDTVVNKVDSVLKCTVQSPGNDYYTEEDEYCLNLASGDECALYEVVGTEQETMLDEYVAPQVDASGKPTSVGYLRTNVTNNRLASTYETNIRKDPGRRAYKYVNGTRQEITKYTVQIPGAASPSVFVTGYEYCLGKTETECKEYSYDDPCADVLPADMGAAVKKVKSRTYTRAASSQGSLTSVYKMCDDSDHSETTPDECHEVPTPVGETCTNGVWMQCKRQADEGTASATARGTTYGYCAVYPQCVGHESDSTILKEKERSYTKPSKTSNNNYYDTPGKVTDVKIACDGTTISTDESAEDQCEEVPDTMPICPSGKVLKSCKRKGDESSALKAESLYNLCTTGTSIFSAISAVAESANDPCAGLSSAEAAKTVKSTTVEQVARSSSAPRTTTTTRAMCSGDPQVEVNYEKCKPVIPTPDGKTCSNGVWMQCSGGANGEPDGYCETNADTTYVAPVVNSGIPGYLHTVITRNNQTIFVNDKEDKCDPVIASVTTRAAQSTTVYSGYKCTCGGVGGVCAQTEDTYYLGDIVGHESEATFKDLGQIYEQAAENDPCAGLSSAEAAKTVKKTEYEYVGKTASGNVTGVGYVKKTKVMCDDTSTVPHKEDELIYDTCLPAAADSNCNSTGDKNYTCYNQTLPLSNDSREYKSCNPEGKVDAIMTANAINDKLNKDITFTTGSYNDEQYILMNATGVTNKPVVAVDTLKPQSLFDTWKDQYTTLNGEKCKALFGNIEGLNCATGAGLTEEMMFESFSDYGNWKKEQVLVDNVTNEDALSRETYRQSLTPCQGGFTIVAAGQTSGGDNKYTMTCDD